MQAYSMNGSAQRDDTLKKGFKTCKLSPHRVQTGLERVHCMAGCIKSLVALPTHL